MSIPHSKMVQVSLAGCGQSPLPCYCLTFLPDHSCGAPCCRRGSRAACWPKQPAPGAWARSRIGCACCAVSFGWDNKPLSRQPNALARPLEASPPTYCRRHACCGDDCARPEHAADAAAGGAATASCRQRAAGQRVAGQPARVLYGGPADARPADAAPHAGSLHVPAATALPPDAGAGRYRCAAQAGGALLHLAKLAFVGGETRCHLFPTWTLLQSCRRHRLCSAWPCSTCSNSAWRSCCRPSFLRALSRLCCRQRWQVRLRLVQARGGGARSAWQSGQLPLRARPGGLVWRLGGLATTRFTRPASSRAFTLYSWCVVLAQCSPLHMLPNG